MVIVHRAVIRAKDPVRLLLHPRAVAPATCPPAAAPRRSEPAKTTRAAEDGDGGGSPSSVVES